MLRNFRINCIVRVLGILLTMILSIFLALKAGFWISAGIVMSLVLVQSFDLIRYVEKTNLRLSRLLSAIENEDFSLQFYEDRKGDTFKELVTALNRVMQRFSETRKGREEAVHFLQTLMDQSPVAILVFDRKGIIHFQNRALNRMLGRENIRELDELKSDYPELYDVLQQLGHEETRNLSIRRGSTLENISVRAARFGLFGQVLNLVSLQNIYSELEGRELESWQKLMRVLTHEIMNSVTPIVSLAQSTASVLERNDFADKADAIRALQTIHRRGEGLMAFTQSYRSMNRVPRVNIARMDLGALLEGMLALMRTKAEERQVSLEHEIEKALWIEGDAALLEQVFINLFLNAFDALENRKTRRLFTQAGRNGNRIEVRLQDSGCGIPAENLDKIFVPFFTTKKEGSGVGLSISRQILRHMAASIRLESRENDGTTAIIRFPVA